MANEDEPAERLPGHPLEPDVARMRASIDAVADRIVDHVASLPRQPAWGNNDPQAIATALERAREAMPEKGEDLESVLAYLFDEAVPVSFNTAGPGYLAYIPGGGVFDASLGAWIADAVNRYVGVFAAAPLLSQIEANVVAWFAEIVGYPQSARGFLTSGGSIANFTGIVTARRERLGEDFLNGVIYASDQTHHCVLKAASIAGFPERAVRMLPADRNFRLRPEDVAAAAAEDRAAGREPFLLVASAGTTNSGAIDPLDELADVAAQEGLWFHVDAAYGGFFALTERGRESMAGIERSDSLVLDPHKSLFMPYGLGSLIVRDGAALRRAHSIRADYMPPMQDDTDRVDFCEISPELSRSFRGLRIWLPLKMHGIDVFRRDLDEKLDLIAWATEELRSEPEIEIVAEPQVTVVAWRWVPEGVDEPDLDDLNQRLLDRINRRQRVYLTATRLRGRFVIRICVLSFRTHADRMAATLEDIRECLAEMRQEIGPGAASADS
jgi:aromatic-L-amino-acid decarboxylase